MLLRLIAFYQRWISPVLPPRCRFVPSCSSYAMQAIESHGTLRGSSLALRRIFRCHPFHPGGYDPVPQTTRQSDPVSAPTSARTNDSSGEHLPNNRY